MKKYLAILACLMLFASVDVFAAAAGGPNNNQSTEWLMMLSRGASTDVDSAYFNPAGTAMMPAGLYLMVDYQCIIQPVTVKQTPTAVGAGFGLKKKDWEGQKSAYYFGDVYLSYVKDFDAADLGISLFFLPSGGGGGGSFEKGLPMIQASYLAAGGITSQDLEASSAVYSVQANLSSSFLEKALAIALGYRFNYNAESYVANAKNAAGQKDKLEAENSGIGHTIIAGLALNPMKLAKADNSLGSMVIGMRMEWSPEMKVEWDTTAKGTIDPPGLAPPGAVVAGIANTLFADGTKKDVTPSALMDIGVAYTNWNTTLSVTFNYYLDSLNSDFTKYESGGVADKNNWDLGVGVEYNLTAIPLGIGLGYLYSTSNSPDDLRNELSEKLASHSVGAGVSYTIAEKYKLMLAYNFAYYVPVDVNKKTPTTALYKAEYHKMGHDISLGFQGKLL